MARTLSIASSLSLLAGLAGLAGCPDRTISSVTPNQTGAQTKKIPISADVDILFVIDNSASTADKQAIFSSNFPNFVAALDAFPTGRPNLHIGVVDTTVDIKTQGYSNGATGCPSPDPGDDGVLQNTARVAGCQPPNGRFISDIKNTGGSRTVNYTGTLDQALSCIALVGTTGCGFEAQLEAMKRALDNSRPENAGFVRNGAFLAIVFLTDEDDASVKDTSVFGLADNSVGGHNDYRVQPLFAYACDTPISPSAPGTYTNCKPRTDTNPDNYLQQVNYYAGFLSSVKDPTQTVIAAIAGPPPGTMTDDSPPQQANLNTSNYKIDMLSLNGNVQPLALQPSCSATINGNPAIGRPGLRLKSFVDLFGTHGKFYNICQSDYSNALKDIGKTLFNAISPCLEGSIDTTDTDSSNPGVQLNCSVKDVVNEGTPSQTETLIPACKMQDANTPVPGQMLCWWVDMNTNSCPSPDTGYEINIVRSSPPATGTNVDVECVIK